MVHLKASLWLRRVVRPTRTGTLTLMLPTVVELTSTWCCYPELKVDQSRNTKPGILPLSSGFIANVRSRCRWRKENADTHSPVDRENPCRFPRLRTSPRRTDRRTWSRHRRMLGKNDWMMKNSRAPLTGIAAGNLASWTLFYISKGHCTKHIPQSVRIRTIEFLLRRFWFILASSYLD